MQFSYNTQRLLLKVVNESDASQVLNFLERNKDFFEPFESAKVPAYYTEKYQRNILKSEFKAFLKCKYIRFYVYKKDDSERIIGTISFSNFLTYPFLCVSIGYKFDKTECGKGYAAEAITNAIHAVFSETNIHRITAYVLPENEPSKKLLERIGFEYEGICKKSICICGEFKDHMQYALINCNYSYTSQ